MDQEFIQAYESPGLMPPHQPSMVLEPLYEGLRALNARVAQEFLALAGALQSNSIRAREIAAESRKATGSEAIQQNSNSIAVLQRILTESAAISEMVEISKEEMLNILSRVSGIRGPLRTLAKIRCMLQTIAVLSRIESGRITNTVVNLSSLSTDIETLAGEIQRHLDRIGEVAIRLQALLHSGSRDLNKFGKQEQLQTAELIRHTQSVLGPIITRSEASQAAVRNIDERYGNFQRATDKVVMSLQSEDIARQRVEHVQEAIRRVSATLENGAGIESCASLLTLQRSQLVSTRELIAESIQTIQSELQSLGPRIRELVSQTAELAEETDENGRSFAAGIDSRLEGISSVFAQCSSSVKAVLSIVNSVVPEVENMTEGACALEEIEASIHLISLNAAVKTEHLGSEGVAIGVIAARLHSVTKESEGDTRAVLGDLAAIKSSLSKITAGDDIAERSLMMTTSGEVVRNELAGLSKSVRAASQEMTAGLTLVRQKAEELCVELERSCELSMRASSVLPLFDEQLQHFDESVAQLGYTSEMAGLGREGVEAEDLAKLYSMESERKLHQKIFGEGTVAAAAADSGEFGDDVELF